MQLIIPGSITECHYNANFLLTKNVLPAPADPTLVDPCAAFSANQYKLVYGPAAAACINKAWQSVGCLTKAKSALGFTAFAEDNYSRMLAKMQALATQTDTTSRTTCYGSDSSKWIITGVFPKRSTGAIVLLWQWHGTYSRPDMPDSVCVL